MKTQTFLLTLVSICSVTLAADLPPMAWEKLPNHTGITLVNKAKGLPIWSAVCDPEQPKPYVYPLSTVDGAELTVKSPADHLWHRSLWFAWKFINGVNYWEEDKKTGKSAGLTNIKSVKYKTNDDFSASVEMAIEYAVPGQPPVMTETRMMKFSAPQKDGTYTIDWDGAFTVGDNEIKLDRTPPHFNGKSWSGGYAGLSLRFPPGTKGWSFLTSEGAKSAAEGCAKNARWVDFSGPTKVGPVAGVAICDHPSNPRYPTAWYLNEGHPYFSPAIIYHEPMVLKPHEKMRLRYRVFVHNGTGDAAVLEQTFKQFAATKE